MDVETIAIAALGLVLGPLGLLTWDWIARRLDRNNPDPALRTNRGQAQAIFATTAGLVGMSAVMLIGLWVFDLYPLYSRGSAFFWSFFIGIGLFIAGSRLISHFRGLLHARDGDS